MLFGTSSSLVEKVISISDVETSAFMIYSRFTVAAKQKREKNFYLTMSECGSGKWSFIKLETARLIRVEMFLSW